MVLVYVQNESSSVRSVTSRLGAKRKPTKLTSSIGAVIRHDVYSSDDEYDPLNPSVGSVASVVKVTERK